ncbi:hypothetical protein EYY60_11670 [Flavobacterium zhairuonense]|uniref:hypothetical protein n=1 Tax=Flavobacterium zhairuonense TaxID=2493631 RepID=UPI00104BD893|nr:hypothetical protein [Flavobacterium zhairuonense]KAF2510162.1 hypothetical protein EYY60_11670 [Flavobacterium zhairuonense]
MLYKYNYNESSKRFEPKEKRCGYCFQNEGRNIKNYYFIKLYKVKERTNHIVHRSLKYQEIEIGVSRCNDCFEFHQELSRKSPILKYAVYLLILIFVLPVFGLKVFVIGIALSLVLFFFLHKHATKNIKPQERLTLDQGIASNETIQDLVVDGWVFDKPFA